MIINPKKCVACCRGAMGIAACCRGAMGIAGGCRGAMGIAGAPWRAETRGHALGFVLNPAP